MTPEELAAIVPRLYHLTAPDAVRGIRARGLLTPEAIADRAGLDAEARERLLTRRRPKEVRLEAGGERYVVNDNAPLFTDKLAAVLQDGLAPADWLAMLNARTFFWPDEDGVRSLLGARINRDRPREVLVFDTASLARAHFGRIALSPINSGSTIRKPARRGLATFSKAVDHDYRAWRRLRGGSDRVREIAVRGSVRDAGDHLVKVLDGAAFR